MDVFRRIWDKEDGNKITRSQTNNAFASLLNKISLYERTQKKEKRLRIYDIMYKAAAILLLPLLISGIALWVKQDRPREKVYVQNIEYTTLFGEQKRVILPDSTIVYLNSGSVLVVPEEFINSKREVFLIGEGYFDVAENKEKPFVVNTNLIGVEALGTEFVVTSYLQDNSVRATLTEGSVRVNSNKDQTIRPEILAPSQQLYYASNMTDFEIKEVDTSLYTSWKDGHLIFDNTPFNQVIEQVERKFGIHIKYNNYKLKDYGITVKFIQDQDINEVISVLSKIAYFKYSIKSDTVYILK